jgi:hypothetical protein
VHKFAADIFIRCLVLQEKGMAGLAEYLQDECIALFDSVQEDFHIARLKALNYGYEGEREIPFADKIFALDKWEKIVDYTADLRDMQAKLSAVAERGAQGILGISPQAQMVKAYGQALNGSGGISGLNRRAVEVFCALPGIADNTEPSELPEVQEKLEALFEKHSKQYSAQARGPGR